jgi:hypothetical protein
MPLIAGTWLLKATAVAKVESTFTLGPPKAPKATRKDGRDLIDPSWIPPPGPPNPTVELVIGSDKRTVVNAEAFNKTGAKYRCRFHSPYLQLVR